jgi:hypothetical protein
VAAAGAGGEQKRAGEPRAGAIAAPSVLTQASAPPVLTRASGPLVLTRASHRHRPRSLLSRAAAIGRQPLTRSAVHSPFTSWLRATPPSPAAANAPPSGGRAALLL